MAAASPEGATAWRLLKARELLAGKNGTSTAAAAALMLRPVLDRLPDHPDANLLAAVALSRLHNVRPSAEHLNKAVKSDPTRVGEALQLALTFRVNGNWTDPSSVTDAWIDLTRIEYRVNARVKGKDFKAGSAESAAAAAATIVRLVILAEHSERAEDRPLAMATYRELLRLDPRHHLSCDNLAAHLTRSPDHLQEALSLASRAIEIVPENPIYTETLNEVRAAIEAAQSDED